MKRLVLGVIGHVDHGKTALVRALTGQDTDRLVEERARGISIALGFAHLALADGTVVDLIDMPGHERFVRTLVAGATGIDAVLLVVAANEGINAQTIEHADIAGLLGMKRAVIAVSKADLVDEETAEVVSAEAASLLVDRGFDPPTAVVTSATSGAGIDNLRAAIGQLSADATPPTCDGIAFLPIDRAFAIAGHGPVVTGTLRGGALAPGDRLTLFPARREVRVRVVQVHGEKVVSAAPGQRVALNLRGVPIGDLARGMSLAAPDAIEPGEWLSVALRSVPGAPPLRNGRRLRALLGTGEVEVRLRLLDRDVLEPGEGALAQIHCDDPVAIPARGHVVLRMTSPAGTVAGGAIIEVGGRRLKRNHSPVLARLATLAGATPAQIVAAEAGQEEGTSLIALSRLTALAPWRVAELLADLPVEVTREGAVLDRAGLETLVASIPALLARRPNGMAAGAIPAPNPALRDEALARLLASRSIVRRGHLYTVPHLVDDRARAQGDAHLAARLAAAMREAGLGPPTPRELAADPAAARAAERLLRDGTLVRAVDRAKGKELLFHAEAIAEARRRLAPLLADGDGLLVTEIAAALGISRKFAMPLLDHLDTIRFTRRVGDRRRLYADVAAVQAARP